jgi:adenylate cyclase
VKNAKAMLAGGACFVLAAIYLFVSAPPQLPDGVGGGRAIPAESALALLDAESAAIRAMYTREIVGEGTRQGLAFREDWKKDGVAAGPLPALLLRETSNRLQMQVPELSLFLGSDYPLVRENLFTGQQAIYYQEVKKTLKPKYFYDSAQARTTAMFPDNASAPACVSCHNQHPNTPKKDWVLNEPMGATTWSYAGRQVSSETLLRMIAQLRNSAAESYGAYLQKVPRFDGNRPVVGDKWPRDGLYLPDVATFRKAVEMQNSARTLNSLLAATEAKPAAASTIAGAHP